jgi:UDP-3-O-[3-hydroxymyristoyl] N-acetylglucosamine deacetylase
MSNRAISVFQRPDERLNMNQSTYKTLARPVETCGVGLHSGKTVQACLLPSELPGFRFRRTDLPAAPLLPASLQHVAGTTHATTLECDGVTVSTTEHLLAALWTQGVTHCVIELDSPELPILDGSAIEWCRLVEESGLQAAGSDQESRPTFTLREPVWFSDGDISVLGLPHHELRLSVCVEFPRDYVGRQTLDIVVSSTSFVHEMAPARTFTLLEWIEPLRAAGLIQGGNLGNAVVLDEHGPSSSWRFPDEIVRHKALDVLGDIALLFGEDGGALQAHIITTRSGHGVHRQWMNHCLRRKRLNAYTNSTVSHYCGVETGQVSAHQLVRV